MCSCVSGVECLLFEREREREFVCVKGELAGRGDGLTSAE